MTDFELSDALMTIEEAMAILHRSRRTVLEMVRRRELQARGTRNKLILRRSVERWIYDERIRTPPTHFDRAEQMESCPMLEWATAEEWATNHIYKLARPARIAMDGGRCVRCGSRERLEVNHVAALEATGYRPGCVHHLAGLETLCRSCPMRETVQQRRDFRFERVGR